MPEFWNGKQMTWSVLARVDGQAYSLFGVPDPGTGVEAASLEDAAYTSTHTTFTLSAGPAQFVLDFLSPIAPLDYLRQSLPFSYLTVSASGSEGASPDIQVYSDIDDSWAGLFGEYVSLSWTYATTQSDTHVFTLVPQGTPAYSEVDDMATWGTAVYSTRPHESNVTSRVGNSSVVRGDFAANGSLSGGWSWTPGGVVGYSHELGTVSSAKNVTFAVGLWRQNAINYLGQPRTAYFTSSCPDINCACIHALEDFHFADAEARTLDTNIVTTAANVGGGKYSDIVTLSARQAFGGVDITIPSDSLDTIDVMAFIKEISSDGNVNTIDVLLPIAPILYVMAPDYLRLLLEPVLRYLATGAWPHNYTIHDIGAHYPNATGHNNGTAEQMPVEECGDLLILAYMYQYATHDTSWGQKYHDLFQAYADYLVAHGLHPASQLSSDDGAGPAANQTSLAIKAAVALNAFGEMFGQANYSSIGKSFATTLFRNASGTDPDKTHFTLIQGQASSWSMHYNLYLDVLLNLSTFPSAAYAMQTEYYQSVRSAAGVALDSRTNWGKTDWMMFSAATAMAAGVGNEGARDMFIDDVHAFMTNGMNAVPFSDRYIVYSNASDVQGAWSLYRARPVVGGHFALMALNGPGQIEVGGGETR